MIDFDMKITDCTFNPMSTDYRVGYESGLKSQQVKIDELQGRIDEALDMLQGVKGKVLLDDIVDTLKGNKDD